MSFQRLVVAISVALALGVLVFLLRQTQASGGDVDRYNTGQGIIQNLQSLQSALRSEALQARVELDADGEGIERRRTALADAVNQVSTSGFAIGTGSAVQTTLSAYMQAVNSDLDTAERFQVALNNVSLQWAALQAETYALLQQEPPVNAQVHDRLVQVLKTAIAYAITGNDNELSALQSAVADVNDSANNLKEGDLRSSLDRIANAANALQTARQQLFTQELALDAAGDDVALLRLQNAFAGDYEARLEDGRRYRLILAIYTVGLLVVLGLMALRLRNSFRELDQLNEDLQHTNANLEHLVEARTGELRQALSDLKAQQTQLIQSEKMASLGQMVAGVAHEINTPLGYTRSNVETVKESLGGLRDIVPEGEAADIFNDLNSLLEDSEHGLEQISELVMSLKNFSRIDRSKTEMFDVNDGLDTALKICHNQMKGRVEIQRAYQGDLPRLPCAPSQINQVFLNILNNAAQAIDGNGIIRIATKSDGDFVQISIRDNGCGMDEQTRAHIFEPFFTTKAVGSGTGLGLSIVFRIIEDHGGSIDVESVPGKGTVFRIKLPLQPRTAHAEDVAKDIFG